MVNCDFLRMVSLLLVLGEGGVMVIVLFRWERKERKEFGGDCGGFQREVGKGFEEM